MARGAWTSDPPDCGLSLRALRGGPIAPLPGWQRPGGQGPGYLGALSPRIRYPTPLCSRSILQGGSRRVLPGPPTGPPRGRKSDLVDRVRGVGGFGHLTPHVPAHRAAGSAAFGQGTVSNPAAGAAAP